MVIKNAAAAAAAAAPPLPPRSSFVRCANARANPILVERRARHAKREPQRARNALPAEPEAMQGESRGERKGGGEKKKWDHLSRARARNANDE